MFSLQEVEYTEFAREKLRAVAWAGKLLERLERTAASCPKTRR
jgi:hypothetical protein